MSREADAMRTACCLLAYAALRPGVNLNPLLPAWSNWSPKPCNPEPCMRCAGASAGRGPARDIHLARHGRDGHPNP